MSVRLSAGALAAIMLLTGPPCAGPGGELLLSSAHAQSRLRTLIDRLRRATLPEGIVKTNGRIEATQVDVSAKYAGRLATLTVNEGDEVTAGQVVARISSPEYEAQLRGARAQVLRAKEALAEAQALIAQRKAERTLAKTDLERGQPLVEKGFLTKQVFDQRVAKAGSENSTVPLHITRRSRFVPRTSIANILLRKMIPDAFPLLLREPESFDIYIGSTAVGNFEIGSSCDQERTKQLDVRAFIERAQSRTLNREM